MKKICAKGYLWFFLTLFLIFEAAILVSIVLLSDKLHDMFTGNYSRLEPQLGIRLFLGKTVVLDTPWSVVAAISVLVLLSVVLLLMLNRSCCTYSFDSDTLCRRGYIFGYKAEIGIGDVISARAYMRYRALILEVQGKEKYSGKVIKFKMDYDNDRTEFLKAFFEHNGRIITEAEDKFIIIEKD